MRSNNTPRGARSGSSRWWLFSAISWNFACWMIWKNQKLAASMANNTTATTRRTMIRVDKVWRSSGIRIAVVLCFF